ncbi:MAG: hypothetical protein PVF28_07870 [Thioalkalispiraceae bacterium]|jgi:hypothetical protein
MSEKMAVVLNGQPVIEYDRSIRLPGHQRAFLDKMDLDMEAGINMNGETMDNPDLSVRAQYIAMHLVQAIQDDNEAMISAMCAYLANRLPDLKKVVAEEQGQNVSIDLVFNEEDNNKVAVQFDPNLMNKH